LAFKQPLIQNVLLCAEKFRKKGSFAGDIATH
jgi:hypothetical protein